MKKFMVVFILVMSVALETYAGTDKIGITASMGPKAYGESGDYSSAFDYLWLGLFLQVSEDSFIRPAILFSYSEPKEEVNVGGEIPSEEKKLAFGAKCAFLFSVIALKNFDFYVGPEVGYVLYKKEENRIGTSKSEDKINVFDVAFKIGGKYLLSEHFGFFGDIGLGVQFYNRTDKDWNSSGTLTGETESRYMNIKTSNAYLGAVIYF